METEKSNPESEPIPRDISQEFLDYPPVEFDGFLRKLRGEPALAITVDWPGVAKAMGLKAFLEDFDALARGQKRTATIRATEEQHKQKLNVFASGVKWERVEE